MFGGLLKRGMIEVRLPVQSARYLREVSCDIDRFRSINDALLRSVLLEQAACRAAGRPAFAATVHVDGLGVLGDEKER